MIRQAINCDICAAEKQESNYWFVAYEQNGELKLRGWEAPQNSRKHVKHLCGQKCAQRLVASFMASVTATTHGEQTKEEIEAEGFAVEPVAEPVKVAAKPERVPRVREREQTDRSLLNPSPVEPKEIDGDWIGPVRFKEDPWEPVVRTRVENLGRGRVQRPV